MSGSKGAVATGPALAVGARGADATGPASGWAGAMGPPTAGGAPSEAAGPGAVGPHTAALMHLAAVTGGGELLLTRLTWGPVGAGDAAATAFGWGAALLLGRRAPAVVPLVCAAVLLALPGITWWGAAALLPLAGLLHRHPGLGPLALAAVGGGPAAWGAAAAVWALGRARPALPWAAGCVALLPAPAAPDGDRPDVIFVTVDALRADVGAELEVSRRLAARGTSFPSAWTNAPWTRPALRALHSGSPSLGRDQAWSPQRTLAEVAAEAGYHTIAVQGGNPYAEQGAWGFRGFERVLDPRERVPGARPADPSPLSAGRPLFARALRREPWRGEAEVLVDRALDALRTTPGPRLLWLHLMDVHLPYAEAGCRPDVLTRGGAREALLADPWWQTGDGRACWASAYREAAGRVDRALLRLVDGVDGALIVITADHGEALGDAGLEHGHTAAAPVSQIPLVTSARWAATGPVDLADVGHTLAAILGAELGEGRDLRGPVAPKEITIGPALYSDEVGVVSPEGALRRAP